jgi:hypothetical protein
MKTAVIISVGNGSTATRIANAAETMNTPTIAQKHF